MPDTLGAPTKNVPPCQAGLGEEPLTSRATSRSSMYSTRCCCCPPSGHDHDRRSRRRRGAQGPMAAGEGPGQPCTGAAVHRQPCVCGRLCPWSPRGSLGGGVGAGLLLLDLRVSLTPLECFQAFTAPAPSFLPGLIKHRWPHCRAARSLNHLPPRLQALGRGGEENPGAQPLGSHPGEGGAGEAPEKTLFPCFRRPPALT